MRRANIQPQTMATVVVGDSPRGQLGRGIGQARIHTGFHRFTEIGRIFHNKYIFSNKNAFQVEIWKCWIRDLGWLPRVVTNNLSYLAYDTKGNLVTLTYFVFAIWFTKFTANLPM